MESRTERLQRGGGEGERDGERGVKEDDLIPLGGVRQRSYPAQQAVAFWVQDGHVKLAIAILHHGNAINPIIGQANRVLQYGVVR